MKKILIILGAIILLILGAVWAYIFLYGVPKDVDEVFARFTEAPKDDVFVGDESDTTIDVEDPTDGDGGNDPRTRLYPLTTRPVAGATFIDGGVRYVERGTGHIYEIDLRGGGERLISGTTVQRTIRALFSPSGDHVALVSESESGLETVLGTLSGARNDDRALSITVLPIGAEEVGFSPTGDALQFFVPNNGEGTGYSYTLATEDIAEIFTIPLTDVRILWGTPTYVYTTPSAYAMGYVYRIGKKGLEYVTAGGKGLMAFSHASGTIVSTIVENNIETRDAVYGEVPLLRLFTEKCARKGTKSRVVYCATPTSIDSSLVYPDDWYKGIADFSDAILEVDSGNASVMVLSNLEEESSRPIDVSMIGTSVPGDMIYLVNKYDGALWMLDLR